MARPGTPNNPEGENGLAPWDHFELEQPQGGAAADNKLKLAAPLAGNRLAAGPLNTPERSQRQAAAPGPTASAPPALLPVTPPSVPSTAEAWARIAALPGASPLVREYAARAAEVLQ